MVRFRSLLFSIGFIFAAAGVSAAKDIYVAQTAQGGGTGANCSNALAYTYFNSAGNWGAGASQIGPGTTVHICGTISLPAGATAFTFQGSGSSGSPVTLYFESGASLTSPNFNSSSGAIIVGSSWAVVDGGTNGSIQNSLTGTSGGACPGGTCSYNSSGEFIYVNGASNVTIQNLSLGVLYDHLSAGDDNSDGAGIFINNSSNVTVNNNTIHDSRYGVFVQPSNGSSNVTVSNNNIYNIDAGTSVGIGNAGISFSGFYFYGNQVHDFANWNTTDYSFHHDGVHIWETQSNDTVASCYVYNNYFSGDFGHGTALTYFENEGGSSTHGTCYFFNNVYAPTASTGGNSFGGVWVETDGSSTPTVYVYNNTFVGSGLTTFDSIWLELQNINETIENNISYNVGIGIYIEDSAGLPTVSNYNDWNTATNGSMFSNNGATYNTVSAWHSATGLDANSSNSSPTLNSDFSLQSGSPASSLGTNLSSVCNGQPNPGLGALCYDKAGKPRPPSGAWDAGAYQGSASTVVPPTAPAVTASVN